jgi:hypothetical protein
LEKTEDARRGEEEKNIKKVITGMELEMELEMHPCAYTVYAVDCVRE